MPQKNPIPIPFPMGGINENAAYAGQAGPVITRCDHILNTRPFDSIERRQRGGQRTGIGKYVDDAISVGDPIQNINTVVEAFDPSQIIADVQLVNKDFSGLANGDFTTLDTDWLGYTATFSAVENATDKPIVLSGAVGNNAASGNSTAEAVYQPGLVLGTSYIVKWKAKHLIASGEHSVFIRVNKGDPVTTKTKYSFRIVGVVGVYRAQLLRHDPGITIVEDTDVDALISDNTYHEFEARVVGNDFTLLIDDSLIWTSAANSSHTGQSGLGFQVYEAAAITTFVENFRVFTGITPASLRTTTAIVVAGGDINTGNKNDGFTIPGSGTGAMNDSGLVGSQPAFNDVFFTDGVAANYQYLDLTTNVVKDWETDVTAGTLPVGSVDPTLACRIIRLYRGRIAMSGLSENPENWFLSASGDPFDWDFSPAVTSATQAVAGNASNVGELGDIVTALIPHQDDLMFMGGDHTLWVMRGDPASGGQIDNVSRQIGVVGQYAWTWDEGSTLYFLGQNGLYRMAPGSGSPELISSKKMDRVFSEVDFQSNNVFLLYDREWQGVHIFFAPINQAGSPTDHYWWDKRTDAFYRDQYPVTVGPTFVHVYDADLQADRAVLLGGFDGFLRFFDSTVNNDDGTAIDSFVRFPLLHPAIPQGQFQMDDLQMNTDANGGASTVFDLYRGTTPEEAAVSTTSLFTKTLAAGRNLPIRKRIRGNALQYRLRNNTAGETWAYENGTVMIAGVGRQRATL